jgi:hypothetical protein
MNKVIIFLVTGELKGYYEACEVVGYTGSYVILKTSSGEQCFSRSDGTWLSGPNLNYRHYKVIDDSLDELQTGDDGFTWTLRVRESAPLTANITISASKTFSQP